MPADVKKADRAGFELFVVNSFHDVSSETLDNRDAEKRGKNGVLRTVMECWDDLTEEDRSQIERIVTDRMTLLRKAD